MRLFSAIGLIALAFFSACLSVSAREVRLPSSVRETGLPLREEARAKTIGNFIGTRETLSKRTLGELIDSAAPVSAKAPGRYTDFPSYWRLANQKSQRTGKAFEAVLARRANNVLSNGDSMLVTAAEGFPKDPSDLVRVSAKGEVLQRYQAKLRLSLKSASKHLANPKYSGLTLVTTRESMEKVLRELEREKQKALRRGIPLGPKYQLVDDALETGRLPTDWFGRDLPTEKGLSKLVQKRSHKLFKKSILQQSRAASGVGRGASDVAKEMLGKGFVVLDVAEMGYGTYRDFGRYSRGEVGGDYLAVKSAVRTGQAGVVMVLILNPEPVVTKAAAVVSVFLIVADVGYDAFYEGKVQHRREEAIQRTLETIDRDERFHSVRLQLLQL